MKCFTYLITVLVVLALLHLIFPQKAYAYLDPGTGSYILQLAIAALLGASFAIKIYWRRIKTFFADFSKRQKEENDDDDDDD